MANILNLFKKKLEEEQINETIEKQPSSKVELLVNELISELAEKHGYRVNGECESITLWIFNGELVEIDQTVDDGFNRIKCNLKREVSR